VFFRLAHPLNQLTDVAVRIFEKNPTYFTEKTYHVGHVSHIVTCFFDKPDPRMTALRAV